MATPDRRDENEQRCEIEDLEPRPGWYRRGGGLAWWWVWILLIGIAYFWFAGWGWGPYGGWWWGQPEVRMQPQVTGSGVGVLDSNNRVAYVGKSFALRNATVERQVNERVFWIGKANASPMLLVVTGNANSNYDAVTDFRRRLDRGARNGPKSSPRNAGKAGVEFDRRRRAQAGAAASISANCVRRKIAERRDQSECIHR